MRIILVDDSEIVRQRIRESLISLNDVQIVAEAKNGVEAVSVITDNKADLVILDIRMPEMNGFEVLKKIRADKNGTKICIFTNYPYIQYKERCMAAGADYFFDKNQDFEEIKKLILKLQAEKIKP